MGFGWREVSSAGGEWGLVGGRSEWGLVGER